MLYPRNSKVFLLISKITRLQAELGETMDDEVRQYKALHPNINISKVLKLDSQLPTDGLLAGALLSVFNVLASDYREFQKSGVFKPSLSERFLTSRGKRLFLSGLLITGVCGFIDFVHINNFSGDEIAQLRFLEWCKAYRIAKCQLEFQGRELQDYQLARYKEMQYHTLNNYDPVDNYVRLLELTARNPEENPGI